MFKSFEQFKKILKLSPHFDIKGKNWDYSYGVEMVDPLRGGVVDDAKGELGEGGGREVGRRWFVVVGKGGKSVVSNEQSKFAPTTGDKEVATNTV